MLNEEDSAGALTLTLVGGLADISGSSPATGTIRYTLSDNLGSLRALYASDKTLLGSNEYTPYGEDYLQTGATATRKFTGHDWDTDTKFYFAPFRYYNPYLARWLSRDPMGMVDGPNVYAYVRLNPVSLVDPHGDAGDSVSETAWRDPVFVLKIIKDSGVIRIGSRLYQSLLDRILAGQTAAIAASNAARQRMAQIEDLVSKLSEKGACAQAEIDKLVAEWLELQAVTIEAFKTYQKWREAYSSLAKAVR